MYRVAVSCVLNVYEVLVEQRRKDVSKEPERHHPLFEGRESAEAFVLGVPREDLEVDRVIQHEIGVFQKLIGGLPRHERLERDAALPRQEKSDGLEPLVLGVKAAVHLENRQRHHYRFFVDLKAEKEENHPREGDVEREELSPWVSAELHHEGDDENDNDYVRVGRFDYGQDLVVVEVMVEKVIEARLLARVDVDIDLRTVFELHSEFALH